MCKRIVSIIIIVITVAFTFVSVHGNSTFADTSDSALTITKSNDEFLSGDNFRDWFLSVEDSALRGVGVIGEGFYIRLGNNINVYDLNGNFSYRHAFKAKSNGPIDVFCAGNELVFLLHRDNEMVTSDIEGSIVSSSELNDETAPVGNLDRRLFSVNKLKITAAEKVLLVKLPPKITLPFFESSHLSVTLEGDSNIGTVTLFDDGGIVFFKEFLLVAYIIIITVVLGVIFVYKTKKRK